MIDSLLLIPCSQRKTLGMLSGPAWELYDGVINRVLKKRLDPGYHWATWLDILIVSAKYGVIRPQRRIKTYDQMLSGDERPGRWAGQLRRMISRRDYRFVHVNLGRAYQLAIGKVEQLFSGAIVTFAEGGIGQRSSQTARWIEWRLRDNQTAPPSSSLLPLTNGIPVETRRQNPPDGKRRFPS